jgi:hypothetical protein
MAMNRMWILLVAVLGPIAAFAQTDAPKPNSQAAPYQPAVPAPSTVNQYGGWSGSSGGGTVAGSSMNGMANVISARGQANLANSAAAVNMTQAQKNEIENQQLAANTYFEMRASQRQAVASERGPRPTAEQLTRIAHQAVPKPLNARQFDPVTGKLIWPDALQEDVFAEQRDKVEALFETLSRYGSLSYSDQCKARKTIDAMVDQLNDQIMSLQPQDYTTCKSFLKTLNYTATHTALTN